MFKRSQRRARARDLAAPPHGVGTMGRTACEFIDFLADAHQTYWQVLPLGHTGFGDSPYQCFSAAAGNPYLIDMDLLVEYGLLTADEVRSGDFNASPDVADFEQLADTRWPLFRKAYSRVTPEMKAAIADFTEENREWLPDYALFMALKEEKYHHAPVYMWPEKDVRDRRPEAPRTSDRGAARRDRLPYFPPVYLLQAVERPACARKGRRASRSSATSHPCFRPTRPDVWTHPELFKLKSDLSPKLVAGVPPDYYSATGQLWGNPVYNWAAHKKDRLRLVDLAHEEQYGAVRCRPSRPFPRASRPTGRSTRPRTPQSTESGARAPAWSCSAPSRRRSAPFRSSQRIWACRPMRCASCCARERLPGHARAHLRLHPGL